MRIRELCQQPHQFVARTGYMLTGRQAPPAHDKPVQLGHVWHPEAIALKRL